MYECLLEANAWIFVLNDMLILLHTLFFLHTIIVESVFDPLSVSRLCKVAEKLPVQNLARS